LGYDGNSGRFFGGFLWFCGGFSLRTRQGNKGAIGHGHQTGPFWGFNGGNIDELEFWVCLDFITKLLVLVLHTDGGFVPSIGQANPGDK
tara:strand:- start:3418 stop:3684 length:267 start_codon:yes stop_codon:yes gene_type:complete